jgi:hypothetical protein
MTREQVVWRTAQPLWTESTAFERPAVLRFADDDFMEQMQVAVAPGGAGLAALVAGSETWQDPGAGLGAPHERGDGTPIKLFQPAHARYYLVTASLVCRRYGHPDHTVAAARDETVAFLLRRLSPRGPAPIDPADPATFLEHGWIPAGPAGSWQLAGAATALPGEARLPLFPITSARAGERRRLLAGLVPVSRRETFEPAAVVAPGAAAGSPDPLAVLADTRFRMLETVVAGLQMILVTGAAAELALVHESLFFTMVDLARWLGEHFPGALAEGSTVLASSLDQKFGTTTWRHALGVALAGEATAGFQEGDDEPAPVAGMSVFSILPAIAALGVEPFEPAGPAMFPTQTTFFDAARKALPAAGSAPLVSEKAPATAGPAVYVTRCLYERPHCPPAERQRLSAPSRAFSLAPFYDPDAPARPVRIVLPVDTSPAGLRKFPRNVSTVLSAELRKQMQRATEDTLRDGSVGAAPPISFGMVCQLSVPIIAICALILLMIIVAVLNIIFFWVPLFKICAPVPKED